MIKTLYIVRHGETEENAQRVYQAGDTPLSEKGRKQALFLQKRFVHIPLEMIHTSPLVRARETAEIINEATHLPIEIEELLGEWRKPTSLIGKSFDSRSSRDFEKARLANRINPHWEWEDEESISEARDRLTQLLLKMETAPQKNLLLVTHYFPLAMILSIVLLGEKGAEFNRQISEHLSMKNTGVTVFQLQDESKSWRLVTWNDHAHLGEPL